MNSFEVERQFTSFSLVRGGHEVGAGLAQRANGQYATDFNGR